LEKEASRGVLVSKAESLAVVGRPKKVAVRCAKKSVECVAGGKFGALRGSRKDLSRNWNQKGFGGKGRSLCELPLG